jgi:hypothetical protein
MRKELDEALCAKYPQIFKNRFGDMRETLMCFGFEHGDGWYNIIDTLCGLMTSEYRQRKDSYEFAKECLEERGGKFPWKSDKVVTAEEVEEERLAMEEAEKHIPIAVQVKEKFGGLRFYVQAATDKHYNYINFAESMSYRTCEVCGNPGKRYTDGWHQTLCDTHAAEQNRRDVEECDE